MESCRCTNDERANWGSNLRKLAMYYTTYFYSPNDPLDSWIYYAICMSNGYQSGTCGCVGRFRTLLGRWREVYHNQFTELNRGGLQARNPEGEFSLTTRRILYLNNSQLRLLKKVSRNSAQLALILLLYGRTCLGYERTSNLQSLQSLTRPRWSPVH